MKRDSDKRIEVPLSQGYKDIMARNPQLFKELAEKKEGYWYPAPDELMNVYKRYQKILDHPDLDDD